MSPLRRTYWFPNRRDQTILLKTKAHPFETDAPLFVLCPLPHGERLATLSPKGWTRRYFNPRSHVGSDVRHYCIGHIIRISIHAPTWGATDGCPIPGRSDKFQSTRPRGERRPVIIPQKMRSIFQSTLPHGERPVIIGRSRRSSGFQSTLPHGERLHGYAQLITTCIFQSTLPHGERRV